MKLIQAIILAAMLLSIPACSSITPEQRTAVVAVADSVLTRYEANSKITAEDATVVRDGIRVALDQDTTTKQKAQTAADLVLKSLVKRGVVKQSDADVINLALIIGGAFAKEPSP